MQTSASDFGKRLGAGVAGVLGADYTYARSRLELRREAPGGRDVVVLAVNGKYSPHLNVAFYFGKHYAAVAKIETALGGYRFPYHVHQYSPNRQPLYQATYKGPDDWNVELSDAIDALASDIAAAIHGMAHPFFEHFADMTCARDAIADADASCLSGPMYWRQLLLLDAALGDLAHFSRWSASLDDWTREQADAEWVKVSKLLP